MISVVHDDQYLWWSVFIMIFLYDDQYL